MSTSSGRRPLRLGGATLGAISILVGPAAISEGETSTPGDQSSPNVSAIARLDLGQLGDIAFWGDVAAVALGAGDEDPDNDGFALVDISEPEHPREISRLLCTQSHFDVAIWHDLVFLAVEAPQGQPAPIGPSCKAEVYTPELTDEDPPATFAGVHVISIKDRKHPEQVAAIPTNNGTGAHTLSILPDLDHAEGPRLLVYANGFGTETIAEVPLDDPAKAARVRDVGPPEPAIGCHDVSFFMPRDLALCASGPSEDSLLWDVKDPENPSVISHINNPLIQHHHGAAFSWDGNTLIIADETIHNTELNECRGGEPSVEGRLWFYDITNPTTPVLRESFQIPQSSTQYCTAHQFNVVPLANGDDVLVAAWCTAGTTIVDFSHLDDIERATFSGLPSGTIEQIGFHQGDPESIVDRSDAWSSYWYNGHIYVTNFPGGSPTGQVSIPTQRGLDVLKVKDSRFDTAIHLGRYNFGLQEEIRGLTP